MGLQLQGGSANIADVQFEGGAGNKTVTIPAAGGTIVTGTGNQTIAGTKTFSSQPVSSATQGTSSNDLVKYGTINTANSAPIKTALNAVGTAPIYACRAWVNFNGTGTVAIRASGNVSSITDHGVGDYSMNYINSMPDANYSINSTGARLQGTYNSIININNTNPVYTISATRFFVVQFNDALVDVPILNITVIR
jgi:hypothetical protein